MAAIALDQHEEAQQVVNRPPRNPTQVPLAFGARHATLTRVIGCRLIGWVRLHGQQRYRKFGRWAYVKRYVTLYY